MTADCPNCVDGGDTRPYEGPHGATTCEDCGVVFTRGGGGVTVAGPRPDYVQAERGGGA